MTAIPPIIKSMTREESYAERRELFKNIWRTSLHINPNDPNILTKPKVIKTLRMDELERCPIGKPKKERIKNLRHVCNKILEFCDRQEADDVHYQRVKRNTPPEKKEDPHMSVKASKNTTIKNPKKTNNTFAHNTEVTVARYADQKTKGETSEAHKESIISPTLPKPTRTVTKRPPLTMRTRMTQNSGQPSKVADSNKARKSTTTGAVSPSHLRKVIKKKSRKKKPSVTINM